MNLEHMRRNVQLRFSSPKIFVFGLCFVLSASTLEYTVVTRREQYLTVQRYGVAPDTVCRAVYQKFSFRNGTTFIVVFTNVSAYSSAYILLLPIDFLSNVFKEIWE